MNGYMGEGKGRMWEGGWRCCRFVSESIFCTLIFNDSGGFKIILRNILIVCCMFVYFIKYYR